MRFGSARGTRHTSLDGDASIVQVATNVAEDLGLETELADGLAICTTSLAPSVDRNSREDGHTLPRLLRCRGAGELDVLDTERIKRLRNRNLGLGIEEGICELLTLCKVQKIGMINKAYHECFF